MANPTTTKPAYPVWDATNYAQLQWGCALHAAAGPHLDVVGNLPARYYDGEAGIQGGIGPVPATATFGGVTAQPTLKWGVNSQILLWPGRAWAAGAVTTNRTWAIVFRHNFPVGKSASLTIANTSAVVLAAGSDGNPVGIGLSITADGVVTWGLSRQSGFFTSGQVLTAGTWYALAVTMTTATGRLFNLYDYTAQAATGQASLTDSASLGNFAYGINDNSVVLNHQYSPNGYNGYPIEVFAALLDNSTWDTGANSKFATFFADPIAFARGTYVPSGGLTAGVANVQEVNNTGIKVAVANPTGGTPAGGLVTAYTYQWYRDTSGPTFTPGAGNILAGATAQVLNDTTMALDTIYYYRCRQGDGTSTVDSNGPAACRARGYLKLGILGDSEVASGSTLPQGLVAAALATGWRLHLHNRGIGSTFYGAPTAPTPTQSWKPGVWVLGWTTAATAGTYTLTYNGQTTTPIAYNASSATVQAALQALATIGAGKAIIPASGTISTSTSYAIILDPTILGTPVSSRPLTIDSSLVTGGPVTCYSNYHNAVRNWLTDAVLVTDVYIYLGTNDAGQLFSSAITFQADVAALANALLGEGLARVWLAAPAYRWLGGAGTGADLVQQYAASIAAVCNGTTIVQADAAYLNTVRDSGQLHDGLHFTIGGFWALGFRQWLALAKVLDPGAIGVGSGGGSFPVLGSAFIRG